MLARHRVRPPATLRFAGRCHTRPPPLGRERTRRHRCGADRLLRHRRAAALAARARRRSAPIRAPTAGTRARRRRSAGSGSTPASRIAVVVATAIGPVGIPSEMLTVVGAGAIVFAFGLLDDIVHLHPAAEARRPVRRRLRRPPQHDLGRVRLEPDARLGDRRSSGSSASRTRSTCSTTWTGSRAASASSPPRTSRSPPPSSIRTATSSSSRRRSRSRCSASSRTTSGSSGPARVFMGDSGSQLIGFVLASLGLMASLEGGRHDDRDGGAAAC